MINQDFWKEYNCIGIMGGTFNPIHNGHILIAKNGFEQFSDIEKIVFMPNAMPKYKDSDDIENSKHRLAMTHIAIKDYEWAALSDMEIKRGGITYTYDTLMDIKSINPDLKIYFIIGADSLASIKKWFRYQDVLSMCTLLVATREKQDLDIVTMGDKLMSEYDFCHIEYIDMEEYDDSYTEIRESINDGVMPYDILPKEVCEYIEENKLYS
ncbi:MAG: nicotinate-nucleotide adenylyltransferase [Lachnospiraceae bacterium]|nr:nicotinate-nucleotide adenylyltransferase [Lachnospiraceae bacterium]